MNKIPPQLPHGTFREKWRRLEILIRVYLDYFNLKSRLS